MAQQLTIADKLDALLHDINSQTSTDLEGLSEKYNLATNFSKKRLNLDRIHSFFEKNPEYFQDLNRLKKFSDEISNNFEINVSYLMKMTLTPMQKLRLLKIDSILTRVDYLFIVDPKLDPARREDTIKRYLSATK